MKPLIVQRSPDVGLGIRMQPLVVPVPVPVPVPVTVPAPDPKPPVWWGWKDADDKGETALVVNYDEGTPGNPYAYWPALWVAVVKDAATVTWAVTFTPKIWFQRYSDPTDVFVVWTGEVITLALPAGPGLPGVIFDWPKIALPDPIEFEGVTITPQEYWSGSYDSPWFPTLPMPSMIAAGNTITVAHHSRSISGTIAAVAFSGTKNLGSVTLDFVRLNLYTGGLS